MEKITFYPPIHTFHIDFMQHVSNIVFIEWMEIGRCRLLDAVGMSVHKIMEQGFGPILVDTQISYKRQLRLGEKVRVDTWVGEMQKVSAHLEFRFSNEQDELVATGRQRGLFIDLNTQRPRRPSPEEMAKFEPFLEKS